MHVHLRWRTDDLGWHHVFFKALKKLEGEFILALLGHRKKKSTFHRNLQYTVNIEGGIKSNAESGERS